MESLIIIILGENDNDDIYLCLCYYFPTKRTLKLTLNSAW